MEEVSGRRWEEDGRERRDSRVARERRERMRTDWIEQERERESFPVIGSDEWKMMTISD